MDNKTLEKGQVLKELIENLKYRLEGLTCESLKIQLKRVDFTKQLKEAEKEYADL